MFTGGLRNHSLGQDQGDYPATVVDSTHLCLQNPWSQSWDSAWASNGATYYISQETEPLTSHAGNYFINSISNNSGAIGVNINAFDLLIGGNRVHISGVTGTGAADVNGDWVINCSYPCTSPTLFGSTFNAGHTYTANTGTLLGPVAAGGGIAVDSTTQNILRWPSNYNSPSFPVCSTDGGKTWTELLNTSTPNYTKITNASWTSAAGGTITYTTDSAHNYGVGQTFSVLGVSPSGYSLNSVTTASGTTGTTIVVTGTGANPGSFVSGGWQQPNTGIGPNYFWVMKWMTADTVTAQTIYLFMPAYGYYKVVNCAPSAPITTAYTQGTGAAYGNSAYYNWTQKGVPGEAGHVFMSPGPFGNGQQVANTGAGLYRYCNGGGTSGSPEVPTLVPNMSPFYVGYGKAQPGKSYPAILVTGFYNGIYGIWRSVDDGSHGSTTCTNGTWQMIPGSDFPVGMTGTNDITGDPNAYGYFYGSTGAADFWGYQNYLLNRDLDPASNDNSPVGLAHVA
jgi:hypothetical protein